MPIIAIVLYKNNKMRIVLTRNCFSVRSFYPTPIALGSQMGSFKHADLKITRSGSTGKLPAL
jgi:hypothetical protein